MKKIKFIISFTLMLVGFLITGESYQLYLDNFETASYNTSLFLNGSPTNTEQKMIHDITKSAEHNKVKVFTVVSDVKSMLLSERRIYGTKDTEKYIKDHFQIYERSFPSLLSGTKKIIVHQLEDLIQNEDLASVSQYYLIGDKDDIYKFKDDLKGIYAGNSPQEGYKSSETINIFLIWLLVSIVMLFLSYYDVLLQKKENFVRITLGERTSSIILRNIVLDTIMYTIIFFALLFVLQNYTNTIFHLRISIGMFIVMVFLNALLYLNLYIYNFKEALANVNSSKKLLIMNYGLKIVTVTIALTVISSNIAVILEALQFYQQRTFFNERADYYYVELAYNSKPDQGEQQAIKKLQEGFLVTEKFYRTFFNQFDATQLVTSGVLGSNVLLANKNSFGYLQEHIDELSKADLQRELYFIVPSRMKEDMDVINRLKSSLEIINQNKFQYNFEILYYDGNPKLICIDQLTMNGSYFMRSPIIIYNNMDLSQSVDTADDSPFRLDYAHDVMYKLSQAKVGDFADEYSSQDNQLHYKLTNALEKYEYQWNIVKRTLYLNMIISVLIIFLEFVIIKSILRLEYEVNALELSVKKILGYTVWRKNRKILLITLVPTILGVVLATGVALYLNIAIFKYLLYGSVFILLIELYIILTYIRKLEKTKIQKILKGGNL